MTTLPQDDDRPRKLDLAVWGRVLRQARPYRRHLLGLAAAGLTVAAVDALLPLITGTLIDEASGAARTNRLLALGGAYAGLIGVLAVCIGAFIWFAGRVVTGLGYDLRQGGFRRLQELSFSFYDRESTGWLVARLTSDCSKLSRVVPWSALDLVWGGGLMLSIAVAMLALDARLALAVLAIVPPLALISLVFQRRLLESSRRVRRSNAIITASFGECLMGVRTTKALVRERENLREFQTLSTEMFGHSMRNALQSAVYLPLVATFGSVGVGLALWKGGVALEGGLDGRLTLGTLVAFMQYAVLFAMPVREMAERFTQLQSAQAAAERVLDLLDAVPEVRDTAEVLAALEASAGQALPDGVAPDGGDARIETVEFADVDFAYAKGEPVLQGFDLTVRAGQTIALVGATGGGKSTIVNLLARFYEPTGGEVRINGVDYRRRSLAWLQEQFGVVLQTPHLFAGTVRDNLRYGRLDATDAEIEAAARLTGAHDFIAALEDGYDTDVGEGGCKLSTGQRQLVALARAVLKDPQVFVLDEATSSVDTETERQIQDAIDAALAGRIAFVIAHRLSTIQAADRILVIDRGRIVEQGTHTDLLAKRGAYHELWTRQFAQAVAAGA